MKNPIHHLKRKHRRQAVTDTTTRMISHRKATEPAPASSDTQAPDSTNEGIIRPQTGRLQLPSDLYNSDADVSDERINLVVIVVVAAALLFIGMIAWLIARQ